MTEKILHFLCLRREQAPALRYPSKEPAGEIHESPGKKHVILSEVAERHEAEGSVTCDAMHCAAFGSRKNGFFDSLSLAQNDTGAFCQDFLDRRKKDG